MTENLSDLRISLRNCAPFDSVNLELPFFDQIRAPALFEEFTLHLGSEVNG
jgi:hypothetical protein